MKTEKENKLNEALAEKSENSLVEKLDQLELDELKGGVNEARIIDEKEEAADNGDKNCCNTSW